VAGRSASTARGGLTYENFRRAGTGFRDVVGMISPQDSVVDPRAHTFTGGRWGIAINGQTYQQEAVVSFRGYQYAAFFTAGGFLALGRRALPDGAWEVARFADYQIKDHKDTHNVAVVGICARDGTVHLSYDHHVHPLRYRRSRAGVALEPGKFAWGPELFGATTSELIPGQAVTDVTYPQFFEAPGERLQLVFRTGSSGDGDWHLWEYEDGAWTRLGVFMGAKGDYQGSPDRCGYPDQFRYGPDGRLHVTWCWREEPALATNHDFCWAYSEDRGRTWRNGAGVEIARTGERPITVDSPGIVVDAIPYQWGQMNTTTAFVDAAGRVHSVRWRNPREAAAGNMNLADWRYYHYWRGSDGVWHDVRLPVHGRKPQLAVARDGRAFLVFCKGDNVDYHDAVASGHLQVAMATEGSGWTDWRVVYESKALFISEPLLDIPRWVAEEVLSVYAQEEPAVPGEPSALHVLDFRG
jgi:hypothetical protein